MFNAFLNIKTFPHKLNWIRDKGLFFESYLNFLLQRGDHFSFTSFSLLPFLTPSWISVFPPGEGLLEERGCRLNLDPGPVHPNFPCYTSHQVCLIPTYFPQSVHKPFQPGFSRSMLSYLFQLNVNAALLHLQPWVIITWWVVLRVKIALVKCFYWKLSVQLSTQRPRNYTCWMNEWAPDAQSLI